MPALSLIFVAMVGMVAGVLAASIVNQRTFTGEQGTIHTNSGAFTVNDNGLAVVANGAADNSTNAITLTSGNVVLSNALTQGHWMDVITFADTGLVSGTHTATIKFYDGAGPQGTQLGSTITSGAWTTSAGSSGTITFYVDLATASLTSPVTAYVTVS